jgi:hypothetical protein
MARRVHQSEIHDALGARYDHVSAQAVFQQALDAATLPRKDDYSVEELSRLAWVLHGRGERAEPAAQALLALASEASSAGDPVMAEEAAELDDDPEWERVETSALPGLVQGVVQAAMDLAMARRGASRLRAEAGERAGDDADAALASLDGADPDELS